MDDDDRVYWLAILKLLRSIEGWACLQTIMLGVITLVALRNGCK